MIIKTYTIPVHRELASSEIIKTNIEDSSFALEIENKKNIEINTDFETRIYNIDKKENQLIIYSNTLNIKVTDKFYNDIPLYFKKNFDIEQEYKDFIKDREEYLVIFDENNYIVYFNKDDDEFIADAEELFVLNNPLKRSNNVKVRKLKNRLKITITEIDSNNASVILPSRYLFEPKIYKNYIEFYESVIFLTNELYYIYNSSFNEVSKKEYCKGNYVKDPINMYSGYFNNIHYYTSWRSNLLFDEKLNTDFYYYLKLNSTNKTDLIEQSIVKKTGEDYLFLFSTTYENNVKNIIPNPYLESTVSTPIGENYSLVYKENQNNKYNKYNDIKFGTERLLLDFEKNLKNKTKYIVSNHEVIYQEDKINTIKEYTEKEYQDLPTFFINNISLFKQKIEVLKETEQGIDNRIYKGN